MEEIFKSNVVSVRYNPQYHLVYLTWNGSMTLEQFKAPFLYLLHSFKPDVYGIMSDVRNQGTVGTEMRAWLQKEASPRAIENGLRYFYVIGVVNIFKQYYANTIFRMLKDSEVVDRKLFQDFHKAESTIQQNIIQYIEILSR